MKLEYCPDHPDCNLVDGVHTQKRRVAAYPDWPPTPGEVERGASDSVLLDTFATHAAEAVEKFKALRDEAIADLEAVNERLAALSLQQANIERQLSSRLAEADNLISAIGRRAKNLPDVAELARTVKALRRDLDHERGERVENVRKFFRTVAGLRG